MIEVVPFKAEHAMSITLQPKQRDPMGEVDAQFAAQMEASKPAYTGIIGDCPVFCAGMIKLWHGRWLMWSMLSEEARRHLPRITKIGRRMLAEHNEPGRVEIIVKSDFEESHRWAKILGFELHHHEERFLPDGSDADIYVRFM